MLLKRKLGQGQTRGHADLLKLQKVDGERKMSVCKFEYRKEKTFQGTAAK